MKSGMHHDVAALTILAAIALVMLLATIPQAPDTAAGTIDPQPTPSPTPSPTPTRTAAPRRILAPILPLSQADPHALPDLGPDLPVCLPQRDTTGRIVSYQLQWVPASVVAFA